MWAYPQGKFEILKYLENFPGVKIEEKRAQGMVASSTRSYTG